MTKKRVHFVAPNSSNANNVRRVNTTGALNNDNANNGNNGVRPLRWRMRMSKSNLKTEYHHQRKMNPVAKGAINTEPLMFGRGNRRELLTTEYEKIHNFGNLYRAYRKARRGKRWKQAAARFETGLMEGLLLLSSQLKHKTYRLSPYNTFEVFEPKRRTVMSNSYKDKIVQHTLCDNVLEPAFIRSFIRDNYASQVGKGTHDGLDRLREFMRRYYRKHGADGWVLKCDITKYFYMIEHDTLKTMIRKKIDDPDVLWLVDMIIDSTEGNIGIPIGNQSSQLFALLYLDGMDHMIKDQMGVKYYGRYMDDFFILHEDKEYLRDCRKKIEEHLAGIGLALNQKTNIFPLRNGIDFLGFRTYMTDTGKVIRKIRRKSKNNMRRKLSKMAKLHKSGQIEIEAVNQSYQSWRAHAAKGNCYYLIQSMDQHYGNLFQGGKKWQKR